MLNKKLAQDDAIFKALELKTINRLICYTDKGILTLQIRKGDTQYHLCLDSVPLDKEKNKELMELLFPVPKIDVPQVKKQLDYSAIPAIAKQVILNEIKTKGRPKATKNR